MCCVYRGLGLKWAVWSLLGVSLMWAFSTASSGRRSGQLTVVTALYSLGVTESFAALLPGGISPSFGINSWVVAYTPFTLAHFVVP